MNKRAFFRAQAKSIVKKLREEKCISYEALARELSKGGWAITEQVLINRVNRGTYSFAFALQLMEIMGAQTISVPLPLVEAPPVPKNVPQ